MIQKSAFNIHHYEFFCSVLVERFYIVCYKLWLLCFACHLKLSPDNNSYITGSLLRLCNVFVSVVGFSIALLYLCAFVQQLCVNLMQDKIDSSEPDSSVIIWWGQCELAPSSVDSLVRQCMSTDVWRWSSVLHAYRGMLLFNTDISWFRYGKPNTYHAHHNEENK